ncbi:25336_t:CDS:2 [Gigaspora margarita]|uniref:25336_t:CDS:1 n=1 Tax=Gigaspora margarita TaxID=4874 RepID=A0ABN7VQJ5_GIGMA|nr:25336_t:CDS:2 [Gigaspora margarita]
MASEDKKTTVTDDLDDIDEELLDDLQEKQMLTYEFQNVLEVLDDFSSQKSNLDSNKQTTTSTATSSKENVINDEEYAAQLAADMEDFVKQFEENEEIKQAFQELMNSVGDETINGIGNNDNNNFEGPNESKEKSFQDKINQTMNKLQNSSDQVDAEISESATDAIVEQMIKQLEDVAGLAGLGENGDMEDMIGGGMDKVLEWMMETLATKDYLYEPMKEFAQKVDNHYFDVIAASLYNRHGCTIYFKYPKWLEENKSKVSKEDYERYEKQSEYIQKIIEKYEAPEFDENNEQQNKAIVSLMQELQELGQPPSDILSELIGMRPNP